MAYISSVAEKTYTIDIGENSPQREIRIDERRFDIDWRQIAALAAGPQIISNIGGRYSSGLVLRLPMDPGANVERGQTVVILEAMKMENDLASPITGKVKEIRVNKGQTVNQGDVLIVVSAE